MRGWGGRFRKIFAESACPAPIVFRMTGEQPGKNFPKMFPLTSEHLRLSTSRTCSIRAGMFSGRVASGISVGECTLREIQIRQEYRYVKSASFWQTGFILGVSLPAVPPGRPGPCGNSGKNQNLRCRKRWLFGFFTSDQEIWLIEPYSFVRRVFCMVP